MKKDNNNSAGIKTPSLSSAVTGAQALLQGIKEQGTSLVLGVPGRESEALLFKEQENLKLFLTAIEQTAGMAAMIMSEITGVTQVVFGTLGPGAANYANSIYTAYADRMPIILIAAQVERNNIFYNSTHQCMETSELFKGISKSAVEVSSVHDILPSLKEAYLISKQEPKGPCVISIPIDCLKEKIDSANLVKFNQQPKNREINRDKGYAEVLSVEECVGKLKQAKKPLIFVGRKSFHVAEHIKRISEKWSIPVVSTYDAKGVLPSDHPNYYFTCTSYAEGILGIPAHKIIFDPSDLILCLGYDWKDDVFPSHFSTDQKTVLSISGNIPQEKRKYFSHISGELEQIIDSLEFCLVEDKGMEEKELYDISSVKKALEKPQVPVVAKHGEMDIFSVVEAVNETKPKNTISCCDVGEYRHFFNLFLKVDKPFQYFTSAGSSSFGTGLPFGIGARLVSPCGTKVLVVTGDGGFNSGAGDLRTIKDFKSNIVILLLNNNANGLIRVYQRKGHRAVNDEAVKHSEISFCDIGRSYGIESFFVKDKEYLKQSLEKSFEKEGPSLIEVSISYSKIIEDRLIGSKLG